MVDIEDLKSSGFRAVRVRLPPPVILMERGMKPDIVLIASPLINWNDFITVATDYIGRSPTRSLDESGHRAGDLFSFVAAIGAFESGRLPLDAARYRHHLLRHLSFTFLVCVDEPNCYFELLKLSSLAISDNSERGGPFAFIISGSLETYRRTIIELCTRSASFNLRYICDAFYLNFVKLGLEEIFFGFNKEGLSDGTFVFSK